MANSAGYLKSLKSESVVQQVINCLTDAMVSGQLRPGDQIPTEPELSAALGVARSSVREATKILTYLGVLESRRSEGTFVTSGFQESMIDPMVYGVILNQGTEDFQNLIELRQLMEAGMMRLAIQKRDEDGLRLLAEKLDAMETVAKERDVQALFQADNEFHDTVSLLCQNPIADKINRVVRVLTHAMRYQTVETMVTTGRAEELVDAHRTLYRMLQDRNLDHLEEKINGTYFLEVGLGAADRAEP